MQANHGVDEPFLFETVICTGVCTWVLGDLELVVGVRGCVFAVSAACIGAGSYFLQDDGDDPLLRQWIEKRFCSFC